MLNYHKIRRFFWIGLLKSAIINFRVLPFNQAIKFPIIVSKKTSVYSLRGEVVINCPIKRGMIRMGFLHTDIFHWEEAILLNIEGKIVFHGKMNLGVGCSIEVAKTGELNIGSNVLIGAQVKIICRERIEIGNNTRIGWESQILDTNFHYIKNINTGEVNRRSTPVKIGDNNWLGNRSSIMAGTKTPDFSVIASNSLCNRDYTLDLAKYCIIGGIPAKLIREGFCRVLDKEEIEIAIGFSENPQAKSLIFNPEIRSC